MKNKEFYKQQIYEVACKRDRFALNKTTKEIECCLKMNCCDCLFDSSHYCCGSRAMKWLEEEHVEPVLDDVEKRYLENVIRPFKDRVKFIRKDYTTGENAFIRVDVYLYSNIEYTDTFSLPYFDVTKMYTGMEKNKCYTLEELGLFE